MAQWLSVSDSSLIIRIQMVLGSIPSIFLTFLHFFRGSGFGFSKGILLEGLGILLRGNGETLGLEMGGFGLEGKVKLWSRETRVCVGWEKDRRIEDV